MNNTPRTDAGVDYWINTGEITELRDISEEMEEELFRTNNLIKDCLAAMPVGYIPTHTPENLPSMIGDLAKELAEETQNSEKLEKELASITQQRDALLNSLQLIWTHLKGERIRHDYITGTEEAGDLKTLQQVCKEALATVEGGAQ